MKMKNVYTTGHQTSLVDKDDNYIGEVVSITQTTESNVSNLSSDFIASSWDIPTGMFIQLKDSMVIIPESASALMVVNTSPTGKMTAVLQVDKYRVETPENAELQIEALLDNDDETIEFSEIEDSTEQYRLMEILPAVNEMVECPVEDCDYGFHADSPLFDVIIGLNDSHKWSREQIADWVETLDLDIYFKLGEENVNED